MSEQLQYTRKPKVKIEQTPMTAASLYSSRIRKSRIQNLHYIYSGANLKKNPYEEKYWQSFSNEANRITTLVPDVTDKESYSRWLKQWRNMYKFITELSRMYKVDRKTGDIEVSNRLHEAANATGKAYVLRLLANELMARRTLYKIAYKVLNNK
jgi:hypothetical protein